MSVLTQLVSKPAVPFALYAEGPNGSAYVLTSSPVKDAESSSRLISAHILKSQSGLPGLPLTSYVRIAMYRLPLEGVESVSTKCPVEKKPTAHEYIKITPAQESADLSQEDAMQLLRLTKRLVLCTECGTLRLIN